jgi:hypothetical protein
MPDDIVNPKTDPPTTDHLSHFIEDIVTRLLTLNHPDASDAADEIERSNEEIYDLLEHGKHQQDCIERLTSTISDMEDSIPKLIEGARRPLLNEIQQLRETNDRLLSMIFPDGPIEFPHKH